MEPFKTHTGSFVLLDRANVLWEQLRVRVRLAFDLRCLRATGYGFAAGELDAVGRMVRGWRKASRPPGPQPVP